MQLDGLFQDTSAKVLVSRSRVFRSLLLLPPRRRPLLLNSLHGVVTVPGFMLLRCGCVGDLVHNLSEKVELLFVGDSLFEMGSKHALRRPLLGLLGSLGDDGNHEEL
jgi:hypothetical protein